ncbi:sigma-70 family RNA polymerase sigma factor [Candidatus Poribacteria bacterium]|nr:sigma-70 family RNA polymerase sigma factor [Candidatus Poribacteria bacterium]
MEAEYSTNLSDVILLARIQNGDDDALVVLIEKYERLLKTIIHHEIHNATEEADIYQETILAVVRRIRRQADDIDSAEQWLTQIARSKYKAFLVNAKKQSLIKESVETDYDATAEQERQRHFQQYHLHGRVLEIREVVEEIGSIYVEVFELWEQGLTEAESAAVLKLPPNTVKSRRNKIRKFLREHFGVSLTPKKRE